MIDTAYDDEAYFDDWAEEFELFVRNPIGAPAGVSFSAVYEEVPTDDPDKQECAVSFTTTNLTVKKDDNIKRMSDATVYTIIDIDYSGPLTHIRAVKVVRDYMGAL